jgi:hypothetical protein
VSAVSPSRGIIGALCVQETQPDHEVIATHMAATTAALQVLVHCLQENSALLHDLRSALMD